MGRVILDAELRKKLNDGRSPVQVCDEAGNVIGEYLPAAELTRRLEYAAARAELWDEEIAEARREMLEHGGVSTDEVRASLADARRKWEQLQQWRREQGQQP